MDYPSDKISLFIHNNEVYHEKHIQAFWEKHKDKFHKTNLIGPEENLKHGKARNMGM
ncbi:UNVERIFIED_CONTAM: hypothetical protein FKN15_046368 [Acipenser sinensis]